MGVVCFCYISLSHFPVQILTFPFGVVKYTGATPEYLLCFMVYFLVNLVRRKHLGEKKNSYFLVMLLQTINWLWHLVKTSGYLN